MIYNVWQRGAGAAGLLGIVNEPTHGAAERAAAKVYGRVFDPERQAWIERTLVVTPAEGQQEQWAARPEEAPHGG